MRIVSATDRLLAIPSLKHVSLSPDGTTVLATVGVVAAGADTEAYELRQISTIDGTSHAPLGTEPGDRFGVWSADGTSFAMLTDRGGSTQVAVVRPENTEPENAEPLIVSALPAGAGGPACWSPDGTMLVVIAPARLDQVDRSKPYRITRATPRFDGIGWLDDAPQLWLIDLRPGLDPADRQRLLTDDGWRWDVAGWSPDGTTILATANHAPDGVGRATEVRIVAVDGTWRVADVPRSENASACWGSDGSVVAVPARIVGDGTGKKKDIWVERLGGAPECRTASFALGVGGAVYGDHAGWLSDANWMAPVPGSSDILVRFADGGRHGIVRVSTEGPESVLPVAAGDRCLNPVAIAGDIALVVTETATAPPELAVLTLTSGQLRTITSFASDAVAPVDVRRFTANAGAGHTTGPDIEAWFMAPLGAATPLPTVLLVHGGPECGFGEAFSVDAHVLCDAGFGVLYCNPRGSTGYGNEFTAAGIGNWGGPPVDD
ncbi:MAG: dipeptidyl aminopeptidase/acylaminoacyl peptidase, partial [Ilumatobacteraceae bacterium]|nr:dipeptidyl aminopeptidase/acylaminoacyl peptidase [Ilumatobacteraceae bacterium]